MQNLNQPIGEAVKCGDRRSTVCNVLSTGDSFMGNTTGKTYSINHQLDCNSHSVIYLLFCKACRIQYVGPISMALDRAV